MDPLLLPYNTFSCKDQTRPFILLLKIPPVLSLCLEENPKVHGHLALVYLSWPHHHLPSPPWVLCSSHTDPKTKKTKTKNKTRALSLLRSLCLLFPLPGTFCTQIFACLAPSYHLDLNSDVTSSEWLVLCCLPSIQKDNTWHTVSEYLWRSEWTKSQNNWTVLYGMTTTTP